MARNIILVKIYDIKRTFYNPFLIWLQVHHIFLLYQTIQRALYVSKHRVRLSTQIIKIILK